MSDTTIRRARPADAAEMARLCGELGYPLSAEEMQRRLGVLLPNDRHLVVVAAERDSLYGWAHGEHRFSLEGGDRAELMGLVVDARSRRGGVGRALVAGIEAWVAARGIRSLTVRSNAARAESHPFYAALGYERSKTQHVYTKAFP
ncbi:MAG TPA: GNAT family N-acetyltransferase [Gammaproteobacteria bacterium]|nr:GNAT family N-acetyltransferase [Gammaproteobacteria bacterium]